MRSDVNHDELHCLCLPLLPKESYKERIGNAKRAEEIFDNLHTHIWSRVNQHLGTEATSFPELVEQLGIMRYGHRPRVGDTFCGSGQIPFEAARLGCDVYASDLNPVACMLTWGAFNIVGASAEEREEIDDEQVALAAKVKEEIDALGIETDGNGWRGKVYLYCLEVTCPTSGWKVPVLPTLVVSKSKKVIVKLLPDPLNKRYAIELESDVSASELKGAENGTLLGQSVVHTVNGFEHRNKISSIRGDYNEIVNGKRINRNRLRQWDIADIVFRDDDIFNERLYAIQWIKGDGSNRPKTEFRSVTPDDLEREARVTAYVQEHLAEWQEKGWVPDMRIETGYNTDQPIRERGWTNWHHLFNPRQLLTAGVFNRLSSARLKFGLSRIVNQSSRLSRWDNAVGSDKVQGVFDTQALNTLYNYGTRSSWFACDLVLAAFKFFPLSKKCRIDIKAIPSNQVALVNDIYITDPPYGDAVKYEEILEFFIAWLRKNPPAEFSDWIWDSRRKL
ncbi:MAG: DNA methylase, partial [Chlorobium sp.]